MISASSSSSISSSCFGPNRSNILNKYVGESEKAIRDLFEDAEKEQEEKGENSQLHVIIFDEIDAICKQRGTSFFFFFVIYTHIYFEFTNNNNNNKQVLTKAEVVFTTVS